MGNQKNAQALNLSSLIVVQPAYNSTVENSMNAIGSSYNINNGASIQISQLPPKKLMNNAQIGGLSNQYDKKNALYGLGGINGGKSLPPPASHSNLQNLLQMHHSNSKERFQIMSEANNTQGNLQDMISKAKMGGASQPQQSTAISEEQQQEEATLQYLKNQIIGAPPPANGKKGPKQYQTRGDNPSSKLISGSNTTTGVSYQQSNTVLPMINNNGMNNTSSPMKVGYNYYQNNILGEGDSGSFATKSHSVAARALGSGNNGGGILERDEVSPNGYAKSFVNQDIRNSHFFKSKIVGSTQSSSVVKQGDDNIIGKSNFGLGQRAHVYPTSTSTDLGLQQTPQNHTQKGINIQQSSTKYNPYSVNYQYLNSCFQIQNQDSSYSPNKNDNIQQSADFASGVLKQNSSQNNGQERSSKIFRIKNQGTTNNIPVINGTNIKTPERPLQKNYSLRRNSMQGQSGVEFADDLEESEDTLNNTQDISPIKSQFIQSSPDQNADRSHCSTYRKREPSQMSHQGPGNQNAAHISNLLDLINVQNAVQVSPGIGVNCFPVSSTINQYSGVFLGDGVLNSAGVPSKSGLGLASDGGSQLKNKKTKHQTIAEESGRGSQIQKSTEFVKDNQKYMNQTPDYISKHNGIGLSQHYLSQQVSTLRDDSSPSFVLSHVLNPGFNPSNFASSIPTQVQKRSLEKMIALSQAAGAERHLQGTTLDCQEIVKTHFAERHHNNLMRQQIALKKRHQNKMAYQQNLPQHIQQLQAQQSEMLLSVLTDLRKRKQATNNAQLGMFRVGNGLNGHENVAFGATIGYGTRTDLNGGMQKNNPENKEKINLAVEGIGGAIVAQKKYANMTKQEQFLQQQFFSRIENKSDLKDYDDGIRNISNNQQDEDVPPLESAKSSDTLIRNQCSLILAMITNSTSNTDSPEDSQLNAEALLSQLSDIVNKCRTVLRGNTHQNTGLSRRALANQSPSILPQPLHQSPQDSVSNMIARKESPLKIIKQVLESRLVEMSNQTMMNSSERKTRDTIKIYEELLNEITLALENIKGNGEERGVNKQNSFIKMNGMTPGVSPKIATGINKQKTMVSKSPFIQKHHHYHQSGQKPKITIYHQPYTNLDQHPINIAIQKINYIIRLIFKPGNIKDNSSSLTAQQQFEEAKLSEIQRMSKYFNILIPKRFESKMALREYIQSKEFLVALKTRINSLLYTAINESNGFSASDLAYFQGVTSLAPTTNQPSLPLPSFAQPTASSVALPLLPPPPPTTNTLLPDLPSGYQLSQQKFFVGRGNNNALVRSILKQRSWWVQYIAPNGQQVHEDEVVSDVSFVWTQWKKQKIIDYLAKNGGVNETATTKQSSNVVNGGGPRLRIYNKMEQNKQLTNKKGVFINMRDFYRKLGQDPFEVLPLTYLIKAGDTQGAEFRRFADHFAEIAQVTKQREAQRQEALNQRYKELEAIRKEQNKGRLIVRKQSPGGKHHRNNGGLQSDYYDEADDDEDYDGGRGYHSPSPDDPYEDFDKDEIVKEIKRRYKVPKNVWIIKPGENTNRGNGINVSSSLSEIKSLVSSGSSSAGYSASAGDHADSKEKTFIVQKYIDHPLLIHNRKFDFRCYGLMTSINGKLKGYFYEDCYIRTSCKEFDISNLDNKYIHLTNDAVQKNSQDYGKYENGNKMSLHDFQKYLKHLGNPQTNPQGDSYYANIDVFRDLMPQIRKLVTDSYRAVYRKIDPGRVRNSFELFGYDFMLDEDFKLSLIEVNTNPCLEISCPLLARIIPEVIDNVFRITLDPIFPSPDLGHNRKCAINEIPQELKFTLVFDDDIDRPVLDELFGYLPALPSGFASSPDQCLTPDNASTKAGLTPMSGGLNPSIPEELIESDAESDLSEGSADEEGGSAAINSPHLKAD